jgi:hypothetical protein
MANTQTFDPVASGFRLASAPITRKPRRPSTKPQPKPQYADAVWYSFQHDHPLEAEVPVRAVEDTIRKLKQAARYLERTHSTQAKKVEVRVQISVEESSVKPRHSVVKFLGHKPWMLGRRVSKAEADAREAGVEAAQDVSAARQDPVVPAPRQAGQHRRTVAGTRPSHRRRSALSCALVWAVITWLQPRFPVCPGMRGCSVSA